MISQYAALQPLSQAALPRISNGGRAYLPVKPSVAVYAHFQYVSGVPERDGSGVSIHKLTILNRLISHLMQIKHESVAKKDSAIEQFASLDATQHLGDIKNIDDIIKSLNTEINSLVEKAQNYAYAPPSLPAGIAVNARA